MHNGYLHSYVLSFTISGFVCAIVEGMITKVEDIVKTVCSGHGYTWLKIKQITLCKLCTQVKLLK